MHVFAGMTKPWPRSKLRDGRGAQAEFLTRTEDRIALLLDVRVALGLDTTQALAEAQALLPAAAPLLALRLHRSVAAAL